MPVIGHALVGLAIATWTRPQITERTESAVYPLGASLWTPVVIGVSYLPDIIAQSSQWFLDRDVRQMTHAGPVAIVVALLVAPLVAMFCQRRLGYTFLLVLGSVLLHDLLDLLQHTDRTFLWPFSSAAIGPDQPMIPSASGQETLWFLAVYALAIVAYRRWRLGRFPSPQPDPGNQQGLRVRTCLNLCVTTLIVASAAGTHHLRAVREAQLEQARRLTHEYHAYQTALATLNLAERWPSTAKPGRIDYLRAWTYEQLKDRKRAEFYYLRSYHADPSYFWTVADLVLFYASSAGPELDRRRAAAPYLSRLREDFSNHQQLHEVLNQVDQRFARDSSEASRSLLSVGQAPSQ